MVAGSYHIHTARSDGNGSKSAVAAAAARAGLAFVILTDHGDGTRPPDPPEYLHGVLCIDAVEISTNGGHYVALGLPSSPYPLGGEPSAVVEDVTRLGGFGIAAHPYHPKAELAWRDWTLPIDGVEWINADAEWRDESPLRLTQALIGYLMRPAPAVASLFDRPSVTIGRWDALARSRSVVALAAVDAHGGRIRAGEEASGRALALGPSYEASFGSLSNRVILERPLSGGDAEADAAAVLRAIRSGRVFSVIDAVATDVVMRFDAANGFTIVSPLPAGADIRSIRSGERTRLEIDTPTAPGEPQVPWVLTNFAGPPPVPAPGEWIRPAERTLSLTSAWRVEKAEGSSGRVAPAASGATLEYALSAGERASQFVALAVDLSLMSQTDVLTFNAVASKPMRVSVQLRLAPDDQRWIKSVYVDSSAREISIPLERMIAAERSFDPKPDATRARSILFVVDLVNSRPGDNGSFTVRNLRAR